MSRSEDLALALRLADAADAVTMPYAARVASLRPETKADSSPVTQADREAEQAIRERLASERPADRVLGEEAGETGPDGRRRWIVDPIDGTREFIAGSDRWETLVALEEDGEIVVAVVSAPVRRERYTAVRGAGATRNGEPLRVTDTATLADARWTTYRADERRNDGRVRAFARAAGALRPPHGYTRVAGGLLDVAFDLAAGLWDYAAPRLLVQEAGGRVTGIDGDDRFSGTILATNGLLHDEAVRALAVRASG